MTCHERITYRTLLVVIIPLQMPFCSDCRCLQI